jgi:hypothetical protein
MKRVKGKSTPAVPPPAPDVPAGFEIRERWAFEPGRVPSDFPLGVACVTMDSSLCRAPATTARKVADYDTYLLRGLDDALAAWRGLDAGVRKRTAVFAYVLPAALVATLARLEARMFGDAFSHFRGPPMAAPDPAVLERCGYDVVAGAWSYDRWESIVTNDGVAREVLEKHGALGELGLFADVAAARSFCGSLPVDRDRGPVYVAEVWRQRERAD